MAGKILVVEDSQFYARLLKQRLQAELPFEVVVAQSLQETEMVLKEGQDFFVALLDLNLPDAPNGEVVDLVVGKGIPSIVFTGTLNDDIRDRILSKNVVDYVVKRDVKEVDHLIELVKRIKKNSNITVLVVDDSSLARQAMVRLLKAQNFKVLEARHGQEALEILGERDDVKLVILDYEMPVMDGLEFIHKARKRFSKDRLKIIGISGYGSGYLSARMLKAGADDFLCKPYINEEFICRVTQCAEAIDLLDALREASIKDYLTGLYNRRYFFEIANKFLENSKRGNVKLAIGMLDIDNFKSINDKYGHEVGDKVLVKVSSILEESVRKADIICRFGGEEFCILLVNVDKTQALEIFERIRKNVEATPIKSGLEIFSPTISVGVCAITDESLEEAIKKADVALYTAKREGKNTIRLASNTNL